MMLDNVIKRLSAEFLIKTPIGSEVEKAMHILVDVQKHLYALSDKTGEEPLTAMKCGTVFVLVVLKKAVNGKKPKEFDRTDWAEVAGAVSDYAVCYDNQKYSEFVFLLYAKYIDFSASILEGRASEDTVAAIRGLAAALRAETETLHKGGISEATYIDRCLWIALEAMIKQLASLMGVVTAASAEQLTQAVASIAFEYGRYLLLQREQNLLSEYLVQQHTLDLELQDKYDAFIKDLLADAESFMNLVDHAFAPDFEALLMNSAKLAKCAGVNELEILDSVEKVDAFFLE